MKSGRLIGSCAALTSRMDRWRAGWNRSSESRQAKLPPLAPLIRESAALHHWHRLDGMKLVTHKLPVFFFYYKVNEYCRREKIFSSPQSGRSRTAITVL